MNTKPVSRPAIFLFASFLILFVTLNVHLLRTDRCVKSLTVDTTTASTAHTTLPTESEVHEQTLLNNARRRRPMPECAKSGAKAEAFFMVFMGHSGSTAILTEIRNHSQTIGGDSEPVDHQQVFNTTEALEITRRILDHGKKVGRMPGFKIRPAHILAAPDAWRAIVKEYGIRIIWQYRKNLFKSAVGEYTNRYLNDSSVVEGLHSNMTREERCKIGVGCSFRIDNFTFLHDRLRAMIRSQRMITSAVAELARDSPCVREVPYEDYLYDRQSVMDDLFQFLGLESEPTAPARFKATSDRMCEIVQNWDEVCDQFYGCVLWQHMLDDARNGCFCNLSSGAPTSQYCDIF